MRELAARNRNVVIPIGGIDDIDALALTHDFGAETRSRAGTASISNDSAAAATISGRRSLFS